ncbi:GNAT family N-acetyltransferase [Thioalkalivibrio sp. ALJ2]|uniref:GNAT family N-acetyltransferase n=1 Tax=Thioalkalivibrio sp. ALJ2 TaxID=1261622 RepID=UPI00036508AF|nr:GNAT family N-acetyltransferase [Thioalkalivibrio sp. ALJ2]
MKADHPMAGHSVARYPVERVRLALRIGEITLGDVSLRMSVDNRHFLQRPAAQAPYAGDAVADGHLARSQPVEGPLPRLSWVAGYLRYVPSQYMRHYIDLDMGWAGYQAKFSSKSRQTMRRKVRKFADASGGTIDWRTYRTPEEIETFRSLAREVSRLTYQERLLNAGLPDDDAFAERSARLAAADQVRAYLLFLDGEPVAYLYCPARDSALVYAYLGYHPKVAALSPGTVLQWLVLESLFQEGRFRYFDFAPGDSPHKALFGSAHQLCADVYYLRRRPRPLALGLAHAATTLASDAVSAALSRLGFKQSLKRFLRRGGASSPVGHDREVIKK